MAEPRVFIHAVAALGPHGDTTPDERRPLAGDPPPLALKELVKKIVGVPLRQASHFAELATIGSQLCLKRLPQPAPENTAVYLGSGFAEMRKNEEVFQQVMPPGPGMASPFDFINTANNMAAFYTARLANFNARNLTVTQEEFSFEWALALALSDLRAGDYPQALVGGVDENFHPRSAHLRRISLRDDQYMGEGSGWLFLGTRAEGARAELLAVSCQPNRNDPVTVINETVTLWQQDGEPVLLLPGFRVEAREIDALCAAQPATVLDHYITRCGAYPTAAAFGLATAIEENRFPAGLVVHANRDALGQVMLTVLRKF
jgi:hypothetical protein